MVARGCEDVLVPPLPPAGEGRILDLVRLLPQAGRGPTITVPTTMPLADCTSPKAVGHLVTAEIATTIDHALTQRWAGAFRARQFRRDPLLGQARHRPRSGRALFRPAGQRDDWPAATTAPLDAMQADVTRRYGVVVLDTEV